VRAFAQRKVERPSIDIVQPIPACLEHVIEFEFGQHPIIEMESGSRAETHTVNAIGPSAYRPADIRLVDGLESFAIFFQPLAFWQLFGVPLRELSNKHYNCEELLGAEVRELWNKMADNILFETRVQIAETFLLEKAVHAHGRTPIMESALWLLKCGGSIKIRDVAYGTALSVRQFERRFADELGMSPKTFARIVRFQLVLDTKVARSDLSWLRLAHRFGYHDQMHMVRDFQGLSGFSPASLLQHLGDIRPDALASRRASKEFRQG
jgi:AraC-like DNA-binding protein